MAKTEVYVANLRSVTLLVWLAFVLGIVVGVGLALSIN